MAKLVCPHCDMKCNSLEFHYEHVCQFLNDPRTEPYGILKHWYGENCPPRYKVKAGVWTDARNFAELVRKVGIRHPDVYLHRARLRKYSLRQVCSVKLRNVLYLDYLHALDFVPIERLDRNARELLGQEDGEVVRDLERKSIHPRLLELEPYQERFAAILNGPHADYLEAVLQRL